MHAILNGERTIDNYSSKNCYLLVEVINRSSLLIEAGSNKHGYVGYYAIEVHSGESVEHIGDYAFKNCASITQATIKGGFLGQYAFLGCINLTKVFLGKGVTKVGYSAFPKNDGLTIYCEALSQPEEWDGNWNRYEANVFWDSEQPQ